jgi:hypothetical protein
MKRSTLSLVIAGAVALSANVSLVETAHADNKNVISFFDKASHAAENSNAFTEAHNAYDNLNARDRLVAKAIFSDAGISTSVMRDIVNGAHKANVPAGWRESKTAAIYKDNALNTAVRQNLAQAQNEYVHTEDKHSEVAQRLRDTISALRTQLPAPVAPVESPKTQALRENLAQAQKAYAQSSDKKGTVGLALRDTMSQLYQQLKASLSEDLASPVVQANISAGYDAAKAKPATYDAPRGAEDAEKVVAPDAIPAVQQKTPVAQKTPVLQPQPLAQKTPVLPPQPVAQKTPVLPPQPVAQKTPVLQPQPVAQKTPVLPPVPAVQKTPVIQPQPVAQKTPVLPPQPVAQKTPVLQPQPVAQKTPVLPPQPVEQKTPVLQPQPAVQKTPVLPPQPAVQKTPLLQPQPVVQKTPVLPPQPVEQKTPVLPPVPAVQKTPVLPPQPAVQKTPVLPPVPAVQKTPVLPPQPVTQMTPPTPTYAGMTKPTVNPQPTQFTPMIMAKPDLETPITITTGETDAPKAIPTANESVTVKNDPVTIDTYQAQIDNEAEAIENNAAGIAANAQETARVNGEVVKQARSLAAVDQQVTAEIENNAAGIAANAQETARVNGEVVKQARSLAAVDQQIAAENEARRKTDATVAAHSAELADHESRIQTLESETNSKFGALKNKVEENRQRASAGIAGVAAMANIPQVTNTQNFSVGAGVGNTDGESALAVGFSARATENVVVKSSVSNDTQHNFVVGAGVSYGW